VNQQSARRKAPAIKALKPWTLELYRVLRRMRVRDDHMHLCMTMALI
jgi:hypothetical protein